VWRGRHRDWIERWDREHRRLAQEGRKRHEDWLVEWRERVAVEAREQKRRFDAIDAAMENDKRVTREIVLELREGRERDRELRDEMRAQREGLLRILDELRGNDGPSPAGA